MCEGNSNLFRYPRKPGVIIERVLDMQEKITEILL